MQKENWEEICGDLHAVRIIGQTGGFPKSSKENLKRSLQCVLQKSKEFGIEGEFRQLSGLKRQFWHFFRSLSEESPPKKRRLDGLVVVQVNKSNLSTVEEKPEAEHSTADKDKSEEKAPENSKEKPENEKSESMDEEKPPAATSTLDNSLLSSSRNDLIKDIESHIEIIYECLDELNETGSTSSTNKTTATNDVITISSETSSQENDKSLNETQSEKEEEKPEKSAAQDESKNE